MDNIYNLENVSKIEENSGFQIEFMQNRPQLENMVNIWSKLTHKTKKVVTKVATTPPTTEAYEPKNHRITEVIKQTPNNNGYVHSREMEYISRMIAEYLATQTAATTTQKITTEPYINKISKQIGEMLKKTPKEEPPSNDELSEAVSLQPSRPHSRMLNYDYMADDVKSIPYQLLFENNQRLENIRRALQPRQSNVEGADENQSIPIEGTFNVSDEVHKVQDTPYREVMEDKHDPVGLNKGGPIPFLDDILPVNTDDFPNFYNESTSTSTVATPDGEEEIVSEILNRHNRTNNKIRTKGLQHNQDSDISFNQLREETKELENNPVTVTTILTTAKDLDQDQAIEIKPKPKLKPKTKKQKSKRTKNIRRKPKIKQNGLGQIEQTKNVTEDVNQPQNKTVVPNKKAKRKQKRKFNQENNGFDSVLPSRKAAQRKRQRINKKTPKYDTDPNRNKKLVIGPANRKYEANNQEYGTMLPSLKVAKINQNEKNKNNQKKDPAAINVSELEEKFNLFNEQYKNMQAEASKHSKITNINNNQPESVPNVKRTQDSSVNTNEFNIMPTVIKNTDTIHVSRNQVQILPFNLSQNHTFEFNSERVQPIAIDIKGLNHFENFGLNMNEPQVIPANVIKEIAERVKLIVLEDMKGSTTGDSSSTTVPPAPVYANANANVGTIANVLSSFTLSSMHTSVTSTITTTENPTTPNNDANQHQVMQKLMEMFNEFKTSTARPLMKTTGHIPINRINLPPRTFPPVLAAFNPYVVDTPPIYKPNPVRPIQVSPYGPGMVPVIISSGANLPKDKVTQYVPHIKFPNNDASASGAITIQTNSDEIAPLAIRISHPVKLINQHIILTTRNPFEKQKKQLERESKNRFEQKYDPRFRQDKIHLDSEYLKKIRYTDRHEYLYKDRLKNVEKPKYTHEFSEKIRGLSQVDVGRHRENSGMQNKQSNGGARKQEFTYTGGLSNLGGMSYPGISHGGYNSPQTAPNDKRTFTDNSDLEPQYLATKFHEKLERIETWPRNAWFRTVTTENCCTDIAARQQVPLAKMKQRSRFDDTHFNNFLKSQQKVTDMLEKILASNTKPTGPHSVELP
ncbi:unnamed protein product [Chrysodeixis includens]|uniref:Uncharacterized protein n=1 Tax=Chrysodeixis includens TaxID=689277 RepID=A0A9N8Q2C2_CHRIL|nr:unnamed protein product [Chrysodeixis includens]